MSRSKLALLMLLLLASLLVLAYFASQPSHKLAIEQSTSPFEHIRLPDGRTGDFRPLVQLGESPPTISLTGLNTHFSVSTQTVSNFDIAFVDQTIPIDTESLKSSGVNVDKDAPIIVAIPGYLSGERVKWADKIAIKWRQIDERANVVAVTWKGGSRSLYKHAVADTPLVARQISIFLAYLAGAAGTTLEDADFVGRIQLVGHSLGAHIAGFVGQDLLGRAGRIVGLDPAGPMFYELPDDHRLSKDDAKLVQVLHTNGGQMKVMHAIASASMKAIGMLGQKTANSTTYDHSVEFGSSWFGIDLQLGHLDYYANGGHLQPGCRDFTHICDHRRAHNIYLSLLDRHIQLTQLVGTQEAIFASLITFYADSYQQFLQEGSVQTRCLQGGWPKNCGALLDVVGPAKNVLELPLTGEKLFFQTNGEDPLVGDQYLLQVELAEEISWDEGCELELEFMFGNDRVNTLALSGQLEVAENGRLAIPFVGPQTFDGLVRSGKAAKGAKLRSIHPSHRQSELVRQAFPTSFSMEILGPKSAGLAEAAARKFAHLFGLNEPSDGCKLAMKSWQVRALVNGLEKKIVGTYVDSLSTPRLHSGQANSPETVLQPSTNPEATFILVDVAVTDGK